MSVNPIISHVYFDNEWHIQSNAEHSQGVAEFASGFASEFGMGEWGRMIGLLHDRGKESEGFQAHIRRSSGYDTDARSKMPSFHSMTGAKVAHTIPAMDQLYWLSNCIAGHHRGLYNIDELELELNKDLPEDIDMTLPAVELKLPPFQMKQSDPSHLTRMLFSCLVDSDWLDTERFMSPSNYEKRGSFNTLPELKERLDTYIRELGSGALTPLNTIRTRIQDRCKEAASLEPGFFSLTVPTGGGKTIASIVWAVNHASKYDKKRIVIAIPFTSIIVQTASILRKIFGAENVIEHHSALNEDKVSENALLACENWDAPVIVTTNVQLFESMFSNRPSACRKLHSLCNSVVILDEIQSLPLTFLQPIVDGMQTYARLFKTSFLFTTATQPILSGEHKGSSGAKFEGIKVRCVREIVPQDYDLHNRLRRVEIEFLKEPFSYEDLGRRFSAFRKVLCVVNTRKHAMEVFNSMKPLEGVEDFHLSRYMCGAHILKVIDRVKSLLKDNAQGVRVIATQLIEAGVDIDFPIVFRQMSGLDSILQAAGRCNREGKEKLGKTYVFSLENEKSMGMIGFATDVMKDLVSLNPDIDCFDPLSISAYYEKLYRRTPSFDKEKIADMQNNVSNCQFEEIAKKFHLIDETGINVIVNYGESDDLVERLRLWGPSRKLSRELGRYSVTIPIYLFKSLESGGLIEEPYKGFFYIPFKEQYDEKTGLKVDNTFLEQTFLI
ncbi:MAG: CRISPR-associated helicase Cas3' [Bacteroides sp.]|nr:CRISPR-associated helicase Cas3' [Bacteroides sp.]